MSAGTAVLVMAGATVAACAQSSAPDAMQPARSLPANMATTSRVSIAQQRPVLRNVTVLRGKTSVEVHLETSVPVKPVARVFSSPQRIVIDLPGVRYDRSRRLSVNSGDVDDVRVALFRVNPPLTRVVVDLTHPHPYRLLPAGTTVILAIDTSSNPALPMRPLPNVTPGDAGIAGSPGDATVPSKIPPPAPPSSPKPEPADSPTAAMQPSEPAVSAALPEVSTVPVPVKPAQLSPAGDEETTPHQAAKANKPGVVRGVTVSRERGAIEVHIEATKPLRASASMLTNPERIVIDLADVRVRAPRRIAVNNGGVQAVSVALYLVNPLVTRVTVDLAHAHPYHLRASGNSLVVRIETDEIKTAGSEPVR